MTHALNQMLVLDYLIANEDRHFNNFGFAPRPGHSGMAWAAPIYDSGSSLGYDKLTPQIRSGRNISCKPFKKTHQDQLRMVTSFDWLDLSKLDGVDQDIREVFAGAEEFIDKERVEAIVASVNQRVQLLATFILTQQPQMDSTENDVEENVGGGVWDETIMTSQHIFYLQKQLLFCIQSAYNIIYKLRFHFCSVSIF